MANWVSLDGGLERHSLRRSGAGMSKKSKKDKAPGEKEKKFSPNINNKKARFNYHIEEKLEAGIALVGTEVKSLRQGKASLEEAFGRIIDGQLWLVGCTISPYEHGNIANHEPGRKRKLLVHKREFKKLQVKLVQKGLTLVPLRIYFTRGLAKVEMALARGKTYGDKRETIKDREAQRDMRRATQKWQR